MSYIGIIGTGVMGQSLALNIARNGYSVSVYDKEKDKALNFKKEKASGIELISPFTELADFISSLDDPKKIILLVPAGKAVDSVLGEIRSFLCPGDIILDFGNSYFKDTIQREQSLREQGIYFFGVGISGGEKGALDGPSLMPGGDQKVYERYLSALMEKIAAHTEDGTPCCRYIGPNGAGHYVKMVHNGIEYGDIQIICEAYEIMHVVWNMDNLEISEVFDTWNKGRLNSYLIEITAEILKRKDDRSNAFLVDMILDEAAQKGTGKWTSMEALDLGVPAPTIAESVFARCISARKDERVKESICFPKDIHSASSSSEDLIAELEQAVYASKIIAYAQGFALLKEASETFKWNLQLGEIALLWRKGCIIRAQFLNRIHAAFRDDPLLANLMMSSEFSADLAQSEKGLRKIVLLGIQEEVYLPAMANSLLYFDGFRSEHLPANLLQAQRDWFGAHTYHRIDRPLSERFHTNWDETKKE